MVMPRKCNFVSETGKPCRMAPLKDSQFCWVHSPEHVKEVQEARRLGGLRRKRESTISNAYQFDTITSADGIQRIVEIAILDTWRWKTAWLETVRWLTWSWLRYEPWR